MVHHFNSGTTVLAAAIAAAIAISATVTVDAAWCIGPNTTGEPNFNDIDTSAPVFVSRLTTTAGSSAELYTVGSNPDDQISLIHLYSATGYGYGLAYGQIFGPQINATLDKFWNHIVNEILNVINGTATDAGIHFPAWFLDDVATDGIEIALDAQNALCAPFMDQSWYDEMKGLSDATGVSYDRIVQVHMLGELTKGQCSYIGASTTSVMLNGITMQLRALDWSMHTHIQDHPTIVIYHPQDPSLGYAFANIAWAGVVMTLTGVSSRQFGISEIGISYPDNTFGDEVPYGIPFVFLERKIVQFGKGIDDAINMIANANRTCHLVLGVADGVAQRSVLVQYSHSIVRFLNGSDLEPLAWWHPRIDPNLVYLAMDWKCESFNSHMSHQLEMYKGKLTPEIAIRNVTAFVRTGSLHLAYMDHTNQQLWVANARGDGESGMENAFERQFVKFQMKPLFAKTFGSD